MRTLLTGFGPFGQTFNNPSERLVAHFARAGVPGLDLTPRVLPVSFARAEQEIRDLLQEGGFDAAVLMGVATRETAIRLERFGRYCEAVSRPDNDGLTPLRPDLRPGEPDCYPATIELEPILEDLIAAGLPARLSDSAGRYVCNHTYYAALRTITERDLPTRCLFVHVPPCPHTFAGPADGPTLPLERQVEAIGRILARLAAGERLPQR